MWGEGVNAIGGCWSIKNSLRTDNVMPEMLFMKSLLDIAECFTQEKQVESSKTAKNKM